MVKLRGIWVTLEEAISDRLSWANPFIESDQSLPKVSASKGYY